MPPQEVSRPCPNAPRPNPASERPHLPPRSHHHRQGPPPQWPHRPSQWRKRPPPRQRRRHAVHQIPRRQQLLRQPVRHHPHPGPQEPDEAQAQADRGLPRREEEDQSPRHERQRGRQLPEPLAESAGAGTPCRICETREDPEAEGAGADLRGGGEAWGWAVPAPGGLPDGSPGRGPVLLARGSTPAPTGRYSLVERRACRP